MHMKTECYLVVTGKPRRFGFSDRYTVEPGAVEVRKKKPALAAHQVAIKINLEVPDALFLRPALELDLRLPAPDHEFRLDPEFEQRITEAVAAAAGETVRVTVTSGGDE